VRQYAQVLAIVKRLCLDPGSAFLFAEDEMAKHLVEQLTGQIGDRLRARRAALELSQAQVAELATMTTEAYSRVERGVSVPTVATLLRLCLGLQLPPEALIGWSRSGEVNSKVASIIEHLHHVPPDALDVVEQLVMYLGRERE